MSSSNSLRPVNVFGEIPSEITALGKSPNDLSEAGQKTVTGTTRTTTVEITDLTGDMVTLTGYSDTRFLLTGNKDADTTAFKITGCTNCTFDGGGYTITYQNVGLENSSTSETAGIWEFSNTGTFEVVNVDIVQASDAPGGGPDSTNYGRGCNPILSLSAGKLSYVGGCYFEWNSPDTNGVAAQYRDGLTVEYNTFNDTGTVVTNRQRGCSVVDHGQNGVSANLIQWNRVLNARHRGFYSSFGPPSTIAQYNEIYADGRDTNGGLIIFYDPSESVTVRYNNVYAVGAHPQCISLHSGAAGEVHDNWCEGMTTRYSVEYGYNNAAAISDRWLADEGTTHVHDNTLISYSQRSVVGAPATQSLGRTIFVYGYAGSERLYEDNVIAAFNLDDETVCKAIGLSLDSGAGSHVFTNNTIIASHAAFWIADEYSSCYDFPLIHTNTIKKVGSDPGFATIKAFNYNEAEVDYANNTYEGGAAKFDIDWGQSPMDSFNNIQRHRWGYMLTVTATSSGSPVTAAAVTVYDKDDNILATGTTNGSGVCVIVGPTHTITTDGGRTDDTEIALTPLRVTVTGAGETTGITPTENTAVAVGD